jgi:hypothetical protein
MANLESDFEYNRDVEEFREREYPMLKGII